LSNVSNVTTDPMMRPKGGWKSIGDVEITVAEYVD
jgi:putative transposase